MNVRNLIVTAIVASATALSMAVASPGVANAKPIDDYNACKARLGHGSSLDCCYVLHGSIMVDKNGHYFACKLDGKDAVIKSQS